MHEWDKAVNHVACSASYDLHTVMQLSCPEKLPQCVTCVLNHPLDIQYTVPRVQVVSLPPLTAKGRVQSQATLLGDS
jgi:hypothetical protein